jgi:hypothetical protein
VDKYVHHVGDKMDKKVLWECEKMDNKARQECVVVDWMMTHEHEKMDAS